MSWGGLSRLFHRRPKIVSVSTPTFVVPTGKRIKVSLNHADDRTSVTVVTIDGELLAYRQDVHK